MQLFPEKIRRIWNGWEIRILVLLSLSLQAILTIFGSRRKYTAKSWLRILVWSAYLSADWVATVVLGNLATTGGGDNSNSPNSNHQLQAFWAPFLLLHLGGPDTITAYSLEDNELWLRHFLSLFVQIGVAFYVQLLFWSSNVLAFMAIPIFIVGSIKYGERVLALRSSSKENFKDFLLLDLKPGPELIKNLKGHILEELPEEESRDQHNEAYFLLKRFALLFAGQILDSYEESNCYQMFEEKSAEDAFNLVAIELGFMYDLLYTKAAIVFSRFGILLRCFSLSNFVSALVVFIVTLDIHAHPAVDIFITFLLISSAIFMELYTLVLHLYSDWARLCLSNCKSKSLFDATSLASRLCFSNHKRWSSSIGQFNLLSYCLKDNNIPLPIRKLFENSHFMTRKEDVSNDLLKLIFTEQMDKIERHKGDHPFSLNATGHWLRARRGDYVLEKRYGIHPDMLWFTASEYYDCSVLAWHIATDLCYYNDLDKCCHGNADNLHPRSKISKCLSDYLLYLMIFCPSMMPEGFGGDSRFRHTCDEAKGFFKSKNLVRSVNSKSVEARKILIQRELNQSEVAHRVNSHPSVFLSGCWLGQKLQSLESEDGWDYGRKWEMISEVWVEILGHTACNSEWNAHAQCLRNGGELLTHVRLFMAHIGLSSQYRVFNSYFVR